jgi:hypothetical protein
MLAGLTLALVASGGLTIHGAGRASADGNLSDCFRAGGVCQAASETSGGALGASPFRVVVPPAVTATENELPPNPYVDLAITLAGQNFDRSPIIQISNLGNEDSGQFEILQLSPPGEREKLFTNLAGGQSVIYHDPSYPADCGVQIEVVIAKHTSADIDPSNNILNFPPSCGPRNAQAIAN